MRDEISAVSITEVFERVAASDPSREAICGEHSSLSYQGARELANRVAHAAIESASWRPGSAPLQHVS